MKELEDNAGQKGYQSLFLITGKTFIPAVSLYNKMRDNAWCIS